MTRKRKLLIIAAAVPVLLVTMAVLSGCKSKGYPLNSRMASNIASYLLR